MNSKSLLAIAFFGTTLLACSNGEESATEEITPQVEQTTFVNQEGVVQLNGSERWPANAETTAGISKMLEQISAFRDLGLPEDISLYNQLGGGLEVTLKGIFDLCTMTGAAHEELHDYLLPVSGYISTIKGTNLEAAKKAMDDLATYLETYWNFFQ